MSGQTADLASAPEVRRAFCCGLFSQESVEKKVKEGGEQIEVTSRGFCSFAVGKKSSWEPRKEADEVQGALGAFDPPHLPSWTHSLLRSTAPIRIAWLEHSVIKSEANCPRMKEEEERWKKGGGERKCCVFAFFQLLILEKWCVKLIERWILIA